MYKKIALGAFATLFSVMVAGLLVQMSSASAVGTEVNGSLNAGETVPTRTPEPGTIPTRTPHPDGGCIEVAHFADFAIGDAYIVVKLNGLLVVEVTYGSVSNCVNVPPGTSLLEVFSVGLRSTEDTLLVSETVTVVSGESYTAVINGDGGNNQPTGINFGSNDQSAPASGKAKVRVAHMAPVDSVLLNTQVDVRDTNLGGIVAGLDNIAFGTVSPYVEVTAGIQYEWAVTNAAGTANLLVLDPVTFQAGEIVTIYVSGGGANRSLDAGVTSNVGSVYAPIIKH